MPRNPDTSNSDAPHRDSLGPGSPAGPCSNSPPCPCDLLLRGVVLTPDAVLPDAAVAIAGGRIAAVGPAATLLAAYRPERVLGSPRHIVLPGLINVHNHSPLMAVRGMLEDIGFAPAYTRGVPQGDALAEEEAYLLARLGAYELLRFGSTTVADFYRHPAALARALQEAGLRSFVGGRVMDVDATALAQGDRRYDPLTGSATFREAADFVTAWTARDPLVTPIISPHAADTCSPALFREVAEYAAAHGIGLHTHLHQSPREVAVVQAEHGRRPVELLDELGALSPRLVAGHCIHMTPDDIRRLGRSGAAVAHVPVGNAAHGCIAPILALEAAGARIALATDTKSGDLFEAMRLALAGARIRATTEGHPEDVFKVKSARVLGWATTGGAAALGAAQDLGRIAPGAAADLVLLDGAAPNLRPLIDGPGLIVHSAQGSNVDTVLVAGRVVLQGGRPTLFDGDEVVDAAQRVAAGLWRRAGHRPLALAV